MKKENFIIVGITLIIVTISVSLAYFAAKIVGTPKDVSLSMKGLYVEFTDNTAELNASGITPGWTYEKTFTIENKSESDYKYNIIIKDLVNTFKTYKYLQYKITSTDGGYNMTDYSYLPKSSTKEDVALAYEVSIDKGKTHTYTIEIKYANDESVDQSIDMGQSLSGTIYIREFTKPTMKLTDKLMADNPTIGTRTTFTAFTETNTGTLYKATEQIGTNPVKDVYYFAGDAKNNWVKFGKTTESSCTYKGKEVFFYNYTGFKNVETQTECETYSLCSSERLGTILVEDSSMCAEEEGTILTEKATWNGTTTKDIYWRIIRTNADGSIKLLYAGTSPDTEKAYIGMSAFNTTYNDPMYVGYKYGTTGSLENNRLNTNDSTIKTYIDNWYKNNLTAYTKYLSKDAVYCNDRNLASRQTYSTTEAFNYAPYERIYTNKQPTYNCTNMSDAFSVNNTSAKLDYPVGLMSIDELVFAGGQCNTKLNAPYAWYYANANGESSYGSAPFCALSPGYWHGYDSNVWGVSGSDYPGFLYGSGVGYSIALRPSLSLSSCNLISRGDGSPENPYVVYTGSGVCE